MPEKPTILIVDDEPFNVDYLEQELEDFGYKTIAAINGKEALNQVEAHLPDMILLDIMMPEMDGFEVLAQLQKNDIWRSIPVVVISATSDMASIVKGIELGADDYLPKPFEPTLLQARLTSGLEKKRFRDIEKKYLQVLQREMEIGKEIQAGFLPDEIPLIKNWDIGAYFHAAREVAGDFYDVFELPNNQLGILLGDVSDKGVGAALYMSLYRSLLRVNLFEKDIQDSAETLLQAVTLTNKYICRVHGSPSFATLFYGILEIETGSLSYVSAGHDPPMILRNGGIVSQVMPTGPAVGMLEDVTFKADEIILDGEQRLVLYTDGVGDAHNSKGERLKMAGFTDLVTQPAETAQDLVDNTIKGIRNFMGNASQFDDLTMLVIGKK
ncbi:MAG: SpoIIE family protein phosphatase [Chloroflexota bacterium]